MTGITGDDVIDRIDAQNERSRTRRPYTFNWPQWAKDDIKRERLRVFWNGEDVTP